MLDYKRKSTDLTVKSVSIITGSWRGEVENVRRFVASAEKERQFIFIFITDCKDKQHESLKIRTGMVHYLHDQHVIIFALPSAFT